MIARSERIAGGIWGLLVGDAVGVPYEFHDAASIPPRHQIELDPPAGFRRAHARVPPGTWSDDGACALCLLASLLAEDRLDVADLGRRLVEWCDRGYMAVDGVVFDIGIQTARALDAIRDGAPAETAGGNDVRSNGNGSLMRVLPLALWHRGSDSALVEEAMLQSRVTHGHLRAQVSCAVYCLWARRLLDGAPDAWASAAAELRRQCRASRPDALAELEQHIRPDDATPGEGSGYVVDCLRSARALLDAEPTYEGVVKAAIALGDDTDTTACVAGGVAGVREGVTAIPARWLERLRGRDLVTPLLDRLLSASSPG